MAVLHLFAVCTSTTDYRNADMQLQRNIFFLVDCCGYAVGAIFSLHSCRLADYRKKFMIADMRICRSNISL
jgi:hypothetical protein